MSDESSRTRWRANTRNFSYKKVSSPETGGGWQRRRRGLPPPPHTHTLADAEIYRLKSMVDGLNKRLLESESVRHEALAKLKAATSIKRRDTQLDLGAKR